MKVVIKIINNIIGSICYWRKTCQRWCWSCRTRMSSSNLRTRRVGGKNADDNVLSSQPIHSPPIHSPPIHSFTTHSFTTHSFIHHPFIHHPFIHHPFIHHPFIHHPFIHHPFIHSPAFSSMHDNPSPTILLSYRSSEKSCLFKPF